MRSNPDIGEESLDNNNNILVPLPLEVIKKIFYFLATTPELTSKRNLELTESSSDTVHVLDDTRDKPTMSVSTQGYKSALSWWYWQRKELTADTLVHRYNKPSNPKFASIDSLVVSSDNAVNNANQLYQLDIVIDVNGIQSTSKV